MQPKNVLNNAGSFILWRGIFFILFGVIAFLWAGLTLWALVIAFGLFALIDGIILIVMYARHHAVWGKSSLWFGILSVIVGIYTLFFPGLTAIVLALCVAVRAFVGGLAEFRMAAKLRKHMASEALLVINGVVSIILAVGLVTLIIIQPIFGVLLLVEVIGIYAVCLGVILVILSSRLKKFTGSIEEPKSTTAVY